MSVKRTVASMRSSSASSWRTEAMNRSIAATIGSGSGTQMTSVVVATGTARAPGIRLAC